MRRLPCLLLVLLLGCPNAPADPGPASPAPVASEAAAAAPAPVASTTPAPPAREWAGRFTSESLSVVLRGDAAALSGEIKKGGKSFPLTVKTVDDDTLTGSFADQDAQFELTLTLDGDTLRLATAGTTYTLKRFVPPNPLAATNPLAAGPEDAPTPETPAPATPDPETPAPATPDPVTPPAATPPTGWIAWKSPMGHRFRYPREWNLQEIEGGLALLPPAQAKDDQGQPLEFYLCQAVPTPDLTRADEPKALQGIQQEVAGVFPFLRRVGEPTPVTAAGGPGVACRFEGKNPKGQDVSATMFMVVIKGTAMALLAAGLREHVTPRMGLARQVFESFDYVSEASIDPRIVGQWRHTSVMSSGGFSMTTDEHLLLKADGTCYSGSKMMGGDAGSSVGSGDGGWKYKGVWSAKNNRLDMRWDAGAVESFSIYVEGDSMMFKGSKNKLWKRVGR